jgi:inosose dehydratase
VGHWIVGGGDPVLAVAEYGDRISHVHVKDVSGGVLAKMISKEVETMGFAVDELKLFVPAGTGLLEVKELFIALDKLNYSGWLMSEQDTAWEPSQEASAVSMANIQAALTS